MIRGPEVRVYKGDGPERPGRFSRTLRECEELWNYSELKPGTFDDLATRQLEMAIEQGRSMVTVLDLGCGSGALIKNIINEAPEPERQLIPKSRELLISHPDLKLGVVGLTDASNATQFLKREPIVLSAYSVPPSASHQVAAEIVYYSITESQGIGQFQEALEMPQVDFILATSFFCFIEKDGQFKQVLSDSIKALRINGGRLVAFKYCSLPPKYWSEEFVEDALCKLTASGIDLREAALLYCLEVDEHKLLSRERRAEILEQFKADSSLSVQYNDDIIIVDKVRSTPDR